ncbi:MAG TPA: ATP-binding protein [Nocardioidaceae bacterium]|jgi:hypothetical protein|nr:ATP-binding protein [Nocardioidaceae bacterium]
MSPAPASTVHVGVEPDPVHVRVVRLVTVSLARLTGLPEEALDDVRLATSEAVGRAVAAHRASRIDDLVQIDVSLGRTLEVRVHDRVPLPAATGTAAVALLQGAAEADLASRVVRESDPGDSNPGDSEPDVLDLASLEGPDSELPVLAEAVSLIEGLVDESAVSTGPDGTSITMRWRRAG